MTFIPNDIKTKHAQVVYLSPMNRLLLPVLFLFFLRSFSFAQEIFGFTPTPQSSEDQEAFQKALKEARKGNAKAMGTLGLMYEKGVGTDPDLKSAFRWLNSGAKKGDAACQNNLGFLYLKGLGVKEEDAQALRWFQKAADQGLASAQSNLGLVYGRGLGVKKDYGLALFWFQKAAEQDDPDAQVNLAQMLSLGEGAPKDWVESYKWFSLALKHPSLTDTQVEELRNDIEWLEKRMTGDQLKEARKRAEDWVSSTSPSNR